MLVFLTWTTASIDLFAAKVRSGNEELVYLFWLKLAGIDMLEYSLSTISEVNFESNLLPILLSKVKTIRDEIIDVNRILEYNFILFFL